MADSPPARMYGGLLSRRLVVGVVLIVLGGAIGAAVVERRTSSSSARPAVLSGSTTVTAAATSTSARATTVEPTIALPPLRLVGAVASQLAPEVPAASTALTADHHKDARDKRVLIVTSDLSDNNFLALRMAVAELGLESDVLLTRNHQLTEDVLWDGNGTGKYGGILLSSSGLVVPGSTAGSWVSTMSASEIGLLWAYERAFGVRQLSLDTFPDGANGSYGLLLDGFIDVDDKGLNVSLTQDVSAVFSDLTPGTHVAIQFARVYQARPVNANATTPLLVTDDGHVVVSITKFDDGRANLAITASTSPDSSLWRLLGERLVGWTLGT